MKNSGIKIDTGVFEVIEILKSGLLAADDI